MKYPTTRNLFSSVQNSHLDSYSKIKIKFEFDKRKKKESQEKLSVTSYRLHDNYEYVAVALQHYEWHNDYCNTITTLLNVLPECMTVLAKAGKRRKKNVADLLDGVTFNVDVQSVVCTATIRPL